MRCAVCRVEAKFACAQCRRGFYCGPLHQQLDWSHNHQSACIGGNNDEDPYDINPEIFKAKADEWDTTGKTPLILGENNLKLWIGNSIGKGKWGRIFNACEDENCKNRVVVKFQAFDESDEEWFQEELTRFRREMKISRAMGEREIGPKIFFAGMISRSKLDEVVETDFPPESNMIGVIVMEKYDSDINIINQKMPEIFSDPKNVQKAVKIMERKLQKMQKEIIHGDLLAKNILVKKSGNDIIDIAFTDFGLSYPNNETEEFLQDMRFTFYRLQQAIFDAMGPSVLSVLKAQTDSAERIELKEKVREMKFLNDLELDIAFSFEYDAEMYKAYEDQLRKNPHRVDYYGLNAFKARYLK